MPLIKPYIRRIPLDVKPKAVGRTLDIPVGETYIAYDITASTQAIRLSLRTVDGELWHRRARKVDAFLAATWNAIRKDELPPQSPQNCVKLSERMYLAWAQSREARTDAIDYGPDMHNPKPIITQRMMPGTEEPILVEAPRLWGHLEQRIEDHLEDRLAELEIAPWALDKAINHQLLTVLGALGTDPDTMVMLRREFLKAARDGIAKRKREAEGDFSDDLAAKRYPRDFQVIDGGKVRAPAPASGVRITSLVDDWWAEAKGAGRSLATYDSYKTTFRHLADFTGHDDAARVTDSDVVAFKDARLKAKVSVSTVHLNLAGLKAVFEWAKLNKKLPTNPARDVKVIKLKATKLREKDFTMEEATAVLQHADKAVGDTKNMLAKNWVPWLCAYSGARVGEMVQLRKADIMQDEETQVWVMCISPEAGTVKDKEVRHVVIHEHLIERGFLAMVEACTTRHLFLPDSNRDTAGLIKTVKGMLVAFVREVVTDPNVAPNHGWRHSFKTRGRGAGIQDSVLDSITGHSPQTVGGRYGRVELATQAAAMSIFPRY